MEDLILVVALIVVAGLLILALLLLRKISNKNTVVVLDENRVSWQELKCPQCRNSMEQGYAMAGKGIFWRDKNEKRPGTFSTINRVLENTLNLQMRPALNLSWRCKTCSLVLLDHSRLLQIKKS